MVVGWQLMAGWYVTVATTAFVVLAIGIRSGKRALVIRDAGLRARAEYEHRLSLAGDARGIYGRYPPVQAGWFPRPAKPLPDAVFRRCNMDTARHPALGGRQTFGL